MDQSQSVFVQAILNGSSIGDIVEEDVDFPVLDIEDFKNKLRQCVENVLAENGREIDTLHPQMIKVVFAHPKLPGSVVQLTKQSQIKDGTQFAVELFLDPNQQDEHEEVIVARETMQAIDPQQVMMPVTPPPEHQVRAEVTMDEAAFREKYGDKDFWERYAKCPESKRKYFFVGKEALDIKALAREAARKQAGKSLDDDEPMWWNELKRGVSGKERIKLTNKLFKFARDYLLKNAERNNFPTSYDFAFMAHSICLSYPFLRTEYRKGFELGWEGLYPLANRSGFKLYDMCYNYRKEHRMTRKQRKIPNFHEEILQEDEIDDQTLDNYEAELRRINPRSHDSIAKCKELMAITRPRRQKMISSELPIFATTTDILDRWSAFRALPFTLIEEEFQFIVENVTKRPIENLAKKWEKMSPIIIQECIDRNLDADQSQILKSLGLENLHDLRSMPEDSMYIAAFIMLPWLFRTSVGRKRPAPSGQSTTPVAEKGCLAPSTTKNYLIAFVEESLSQTDAIAKSKLNGKACQPLILAKTKDGKEGIPEISPKLYVCFSCLTGCLALHSLLKLVFATIFWKTYSVCMV